MSSPYKSRLFTFLNRQSIQWQDRLGKTARQLKVAIAWGTQIVLYPFYLALQTSRLVGRQLQGQGASLPTLGPVTNPPTDQVAQNLVATLNQAIAQVPHQGPLSSDLAALSVTTAAPLATIPQTLGGALREILHRQWQTLTAPSRQILQQGPITAIASLLDTREIVLIQRGRTIIHLPQGFQQALKQYLVVAMAQFHRQRRQYLKQRYQGPLWAPKYLPNIDSSNPNLITAARGFLQLMGWVQHSPVAVAIDLFGESRLSVPILPALPPALPLVPPLPLEKTLIQWDQKIWQWENTKPLFPPAIAPPNLPDPLAPRSSGWQTLWIKAIAYFSGKLPPAPSSSVPVNAVPRPQSLVVKPQESGRWLQWDDLFPGAPHPENDPAPNPQAPGHWLNPIRKLFGQALPTEAIALVPAPSPAGSQACPTPDLGDLWLETAAMATPRTSLTSPYAMAHLGPNQDPSPSDRPGGALGRQTPQEGQNLDHQPDWLEIQATSSGYVRDPLEIILGWLDQGILWCEELVVALAQWCQQCWQRIFTPPPKDSD